MTAIGIIPTHRRRGALRALIARQLADVRAAGEPLAILWASEGSIYQRFGYGLATLTATIELDRERAALRTDALPLGRTRFVDADEAARVFPAIYEPNLAATPGFYSRTPTWWRIEVLADFAWARRGMDRKFYVLHETDGRPDGYVIYRVKHDWTGSLPNSELHVQEIMALDPVALRETWRFIFGVDLIKTIRTRHSDPGEPLLLMVAEPQTPEARLARRPVAARRRCRRRARTAAAMPPTAASSSRCATHSCPRPAAASG